MVLFPIFLLFWTKRLFGGTKLSGVEAGRGLKPIPRSWRCQLHQGSPRKLHTGTGKRRIPDPGQLLTAQQHHFGGIRQQFGNLAWKKQRPSDRNPAPRGARVGLDPHPSSHPAPRGRIWGRFPELPDTRRTAQLHVGTFYSPDALAHCFCSTAKALFIPNRSPSPSSCFFSLYQHPLFPTPRPLCCFPLLEYSLCSEPVFLEEANGQFIQIPFFFLFFFSQDPYKLHAKHCT